MTNKEIIATEQERLAEEGILKYTGRVLEMEMEDGEIVEIKEIQPIHTYKAWKQLGYQVKKGEKCIAKFAIWQYSTRKKKDKDADDENEEQVTDMVYGKYFMKVSAFFTNEQVEKIKEED